MTVEYAKDRRSLDLGAFSVDDAARRLLNYRFAEDICMKSGAGWAATCPTIKLKFAFSEHAYHDSWHVLWLGQRLPDLRVLDGADLEQPPTLRGSDRMEPPNEDFLKFTERLQEEGDELLRLVGLYRVLKTHLTVNYRWYRESTNQIVDEPTVRILNHILLEEEQHLRWGQSMYEELADTPQRRREALEFQMDIEDLLVRAGGVTGDCFER